MDTLMIYTLKVSAAMAMFYLLHIALFRKETFLKLRRGYFIFALLFSLLFPFINLTDWGIGNNLTATTTFNLREVIIFAQDGDRVNDISTSTSHLNYLSVISIFAIGGSLFLFGRLLLQLSSLSNVIRRAKKIESQKRVKILEIDNPAVSSFSFFSFVVLNKHNVNEDNLHDILMHEKTHATQLHSLDIVLYELYCIIFWWNPFAWLMKNEVKLNLEYLADEHVVSSKTDQKAYQYTLLQISIANTGMAFINNFNVSHLKKRIMMMNKKRSPILAMAKYLIILPLAFFLIQCNTSERDNGQANDISSDATERSTNANVVNKEDIESLSEEILEIAEIMPYYPGGEVEMMKFIAENLRYPVIAQEVGAQGRVDVRFIVKEDGSIAGAEVIRNMAELDNKLKEIVVVGYGKEGNKESDQVIVRGGSKDAALEEAKKLMNDECIRVVKAMPKWQPGKQGGKEVPVYFTLPILFRLK